MFHVMLALPALGALAAFGMAVVWTLYVLIQASFWVTCVLGVCCTRRKWFAAIPALFGITACIVCVACNLMLDSTLALIYWGIYLAAALLGYGLAWIIRRVGEWLFAK